MSVPPPSSAFNDSYSITLKELDDFQDKSKNNSNDYFSKNGYRSASSMYTSIIDEFNEKIKNKILYGPEDGAPPTYNPKIVELGKIYTIKFPIFEDSSGKYTFLYYKKRPTDTVLSKFGNRYQVGISSRSVEKRLVKSTNREYYIVVDKELKDIFENAFSESNNIGGRKTRRSRNKRRRTKKRVLKMKK